MKTKSLSIILASAALLAGSMTNAADLIVVLGGIEAGNNYASISAAHAAAADGDRILIHPNQSFYIENLVLTKSVQLLSAVEGQYYKVQGTVTITPAAAGKSIEIHHMDLQTGYGITLNNAPAGNRSNVKVIDCKLRGGSIGANASNYIVNFSRDSLFQGVINFRNGRVIGNYISTIGLGASNHNISCFADVSTSDVNYIVGNHCILTAATANPFYTYGISNGNNTQEFVISGNFIKGNSIYSGGLNLGAFKTGVTHLVENNTYFRGTGASYLGIFLGNFTGVTVNVLNNVIVSGASTYGAIFQNNASNFINVSYNYSSGQTYQGFPNNGTNVIDGTLATTVDANTGQLLAGSVAINAGHPDDQYSDIDGSRNDAGCWGGSYTRENFISHTGGSVTNFVIAPRRILSGGTINISSEGYDR
jgi:hypothetical protein